MCGPASPPFAEARNVKDLLGFLPAGMTVEAILDEYPILERDDILPLSDMQLEALPDHATMKQR